MEDSRKNGSIRLALGYPIHLTDGVHTARLIESETTFMLAVADGLRNQFQCLSGFLLWRPELLSPRFALNPLNCWTSALSQPMKALDPKDTAEV
jgi:hypothetical protein